MNLEVIIKTIICVCATIIILIGLIQKSASDGFSAAFSGNNDLTLFTVQKERGPEKTMSIMMLILSLILVGCLIGLQFI